MTDLLKTASTRRKRAFARRSDEARNNEIIRLFRSGLTSSEIAPLFGIAARSVSALLRSYGVRRSEGGKEVAAAIKRQRAIAAKRLARFEVRGCSPDDFDSDEQFEEARARFKQQKSRAVTRRIGWELTFAEWWSIWRASGKWDVRGRRAADSAVMARRGDVGPYSASNVYITTLANNFVESHFVRGHRVKGLAAEDASVLFHA